MQPGGSGGNPKPAAGLPLAAWKNRRTVLRAGFTCIIALLVFSTIEAFGIQSDVSEHHVASYQRYLDEDEALSRLRRNILIGSTNVRDFFLSSQPDRDKVLRAQLADLGVQSREALDKLDRQQDRAHRRATPRALVDDYWNALRPVANSMRNLDSAAAYDFIQREVVPRRTAAYALLRQLTEEAQKEMQAREEEFAAERGAAVQRLALVLGACIILGFLVAWFSLRHAEGLAGQAVRHYEEVVAAKGEMQRLSERLLDIQEEERRRLSRGLHDEIGQTLTALRIEISHALSRAATPEVRERLERARGLAERSVQTVRDISLLLRPSLLDDLGLAPALQWQLEDFSRRSGIACEFKEEGVEDALPDAVKTCVFRVVQEALNNCEKHAAASHLSVSVRQGAGRLTVEVQDDGRGFEVEHTSATQQRGGIGLLGMRERATRLGGQITLDSKPGRGTRVAVQIPLPDLSRGAGARAAGTATGD
jgi:signal transduction histidine kinase